MNRLEIVDGATLIAVPSIGDDPILVTGTTDSAAALGHAFDAIAAQVEAHRRRPIFPLVAATLAMGFDPGPRPRASSRATPHGTAAALKAEAPHRTLAEQYDVAWNAGDSYPTRVVRRDERRDERRAARKVSNARKARRGFR